MYPRRDVCLVENYLPGNQLNIHTMSRTSRTHDTLLASVVSLDAKVPRRFRGNRVI